MTQTDIVTFPTILWWSILIIPLGFFFFDCFILPLIINGGWLQNKIQIITTIKLNLIQKKIIIFEYQVSELFYPFLF